MEPICLRTPARWCYSPVVSAMNHNPSCACHKSERELDQIKGNPGTRLTPIPAREGKIYRMGRLRFKGEEASLMFG